MPSLKGLRKSPRATSDGDSEPSVNRWRRRFAGQLNTAAVGGRRSEGQPAEGHRLQSGDSMPEPKGHRSRSNMQIHRRPRRPGRDYRGSVRPGMDRIGVAVHSVSPEQGALNIVLRAPCCHCIGRRTVRLCCDSFSYPLSTWAQLGRPASARGSLRAGSRLINYH